MGRQKTGLKRAQRPWRECVFGLLQSQDANRITTRHPRLAKSGANKNRTCEVDGGRNGESELIAGLKQTEQCGKDTGLESRNSIDPNRTGKSLKVKLYALVIGERRSTNPRKFISFLLGSGRCGWCQQSLSCEGGLCWTFFYCNKSKTERKECEVQF